MNEEETLAKLERMRPILDKRVAKRDVRDAYDCAVDVRPLPTPTPDAIRRIAASLKIACRPKNYVFPRCAGRDYHKAEDIDRGKGLSLDDIKAGRGVHTAPGHVCSECRCSRVAGWGTRGWWYWSPDSGLPEVGHYGVGPCFLHSPLYSIGWGAAAQDLDRYRNLVVKEIEAMRNYGQAPDAQAGYLIDMRQEAQVARQRQDTRTALHALHALANETITALRRHRETKSAEDEYIAKVCTIFGFPEDMLDAADRQRLLELAMMRPLIEYVQGKAKPMSDKTSIELERGLLKDISVAAKTAFTVHEDQYTHNDDVLLLLERFYSEAEMSFRARAGEEEWSRFVGALKDVGKGFTDRSIEASAIEG